jgi:HlyD family secretion protein
MPIKSDLCTSTSDRSQANGSRFRHGSRWILAILMVAATIEVGIWYQGRSQMPSFVTQKVVRGDLTVTVSATGTLNSQSSVDVGVEVSGRVDQVLVDINEPVKAGQVIAVINTDQARAQLQQSEATLAANQATLIQSRQKLDRYLNLQKMGAVPLQDLQTAQGDYDRARASIRTAEAQINQHRTTITKATVRAPIDGIVLNRNVAVGQTVAATFQTPVLFTLASDLSKLQLQIDIDESDIGHIRVGQRATFSVGAFPQNRFDASLISLRNAPKTVNNVVTYMGILSVDNRDKILRPGMTATTDVIIAHVANALLVPNSALRFTPQQSALKAAIPPPPPPVNGRLQGRIWLLKDGMPVPRDLVLGMTDGKYTAVLSGDVSPGADAITNVATSAPKAP